MTMPIEIISLLLTGFAIVAGMILSREELRSLVELTHQSPHTLLGMHPLGDGSGLVVRAFLPDAKKIAIQPAHEKDKPAFELKRIPKTNVFEAVTKLANKVYAYDLVITDHQNQTRRTRDAFSFLPTLGESDLFLFGKGDERKIYEKLGSQLRVIDGVPGTSFAVWARTRNASASSAISTTGMDGFIPCGCSAHPVSGRFSFPAWGRARFTNSRSATRMAASS